MRGLLVVAVLAIAVAGLYLTTRLPSGASSRTLVFDAASRSYVLYVPKSKPVKPGLVLVLHGWRGDGASFENRTRGTFDRLADRDGFIVAYPDAAGGQWNTGHPWETAKGDDVGFLSALIDALSSEFDVDLKRVYVTGLSNGAAMTFRLACERPNKIAAIVPVAGGLAERLMQPCADASKRPIPLLLMRGTADPVAFFDDGEREGNVAYWIRRNGCGLIPTISHLEDADPNDGTRTRVESYGACNDGADVVLYAIENGGHHWPGGSESLRWNRNGNECRDFDAAAVAWDFFKKHPMAAAKPGQGP